MAPWSLWQYDDVIDSFLASCNQEMQESIIRRLDILSEKGNLARRPVSAPLEDKLYELFGRAGRERARLIFFFEAGRKIIFVHACYKDQGRLPRREIETAKRNRERIQEGEVTARAIN